MVASGERSPITTVASKRLSLDTFVDVDIFIAETGEGRKARSEQEGLPSLEIGLTSLLQPRTSDSAEHSQQKLFITLVPSCQPAHLFEHSSCSP